MRGATKNMNFAATYILGGPRNRHQQQEQGFHNGGGGSSSPRLTPDYTTNRTSSTNANLNMNLQMQAIRSRLKIGMASAWNREVSERKQVGDAEGMVNEEGAGKGASSEGLEQL